MAKTIVPKAATPRSSIEQMDALGTRLGKLTALLIMTHGQARECFDAMSDGLRDDYMSACFDLAAECQEIVKGAARIEGFAHG